MTCSTQLDEQAYEDMKVALRELVEMRNGLVHHFVSGFDLWSADGCEAAQAHLDSAFTRIDKHDRELRQLAKSMDEGRQALGAFMASEAGENLFVYGITPGDGEMHWPSTMIVHWLRNAESECAREGWTCLPDAIRYIQAKNPGLGPTKYGCSSWRQILHEAKLFEMEKRTDSSSGVTVAWYRSRLSTLPN
ncbi:OST-HTH/LOTUS domain protein [compost metagenome]